MATTAADVLVETLIDWGVDTIFGLPGDGINGIMEALRKRQDKIRFVQVRHEEAAAFMACGYAKFTGRLGVCLATSGPGGIHLLNGLYDAKLDGQPVLAITGHALPRPDRHTLTSRTSSSTSCSWTSPSTTQRVMGAGARRERRRARLPHRARLPRRRPHHHSRSTSRTMTVEADTRSKRNVAAPRLGRLARRARHLPAETICGAPPTILNAGKKVVILAGRGALGAGDELEQLAETLGAPIVKPLLGKAVRARRQPVHHRRHRPARHRAVAGGAWRAATRC